MEGLKNFAQFVVQHWGDITMAILALVALAEAIVRITPTQSDDGAVERIGSVIRKILDFLKVPNNTKQ